LFIDLSRDCHNIIHFEINFIAFSFKLNGQSRTAFGLLKAPELQRLSVTVEVLRVGVISVGVMTVGVLSVGVMTLPQTDM
jgi:hypothetical protein